ncbi:hypothetical protein Lal_00042679 [Lupinus albus]|nr:hypothetical protein Lal_00042679 [Lupinus albus]
MYRYDGWLEAYLKKFGKFLKRKKTSKLGPTRKFTRSSETSTSGQNFTCFECVKPDHIKVDCPTLNKNHFKGNSEKKTFIRSYITWEDNDTSSNS